MEALVRYLSAYLPIEPGSQIPEDVVARGPEALAEHLNAAAADAYDKKVEEIGVELMPLVEKDVMLRTIDWQWMEYLTQMEHFAKALGCARTASATRWSSTRTRPSRCSTSCASESRADRGGHLPGPRAAQRPPPPKPMVRDLLESGPQRSGWRDQAGARSSEAAARGAVGAAAAEGGAAAGKLGATIPAGVARARNTRGVTEDRWKSSSVPKSCSSASCS